MDALKALLETKVPAKPTVAKRVRERKNWIGIKVEAPWLEEFSRKFSRACADRGVDWLRPKSNLHVSLAYGYDNQQHRPLFELAEQMVDPSVSGDWELRLYRTENRCDWQCLFRQVLPKPKRNRATVIFQEGGKVLIGEANRSLWLLPGGGIDYGESPLQAAIRELHEETHIVATSAWSLFFHKAQYHNHYVFRVQGSGTPKAASDVKALRWIDPIEPLPENLSYASQDILRRALVIDTYVF